MKQKSMKKVLQLSIKYLKNDKEFFLKDIKLKNPLCQVKLNSNNK